MSLTVSTSNRQIAPKGGVIVETTPGVANQETSGQTYVPRIKANTVDIDHFAFLPQINVKPTTSKQISLTSVIASGAATNELCDIGESVIGPFTIASTTTVVANTALATHYKYIAVATETASGDEILVIPQLNFTGAGSSDAKKQFVPIVVTDTTTVNSTSGITYKQFQIKLMRTDGLTTALATDVDATIKFLIVRIRGNSMV